MALAERPQSRCSGGGGALADSSGSELARAARPVGTSCFGGVCLAGVHLRPFARCHACASQAMGTGSKSLLPSQPEVSRCCGNLSAGLRGIWINSIVEPKSDSWWDCAFGLRTYLPCIDTPGPGSLENPLAARAGGGGFLYCWKLSRNRCCTRRKDLERRIAITSFWASRLGEYLCDRRL